MKIEYYINMDGDVLMAERIPEEIIKRFDSPLTS